MPEKKKTLNEDLFYKDSSANLPRLHTCKNKVPFWGFKEFAVTGCFAIPKAQASLEPNIRLVSVIYWTLVWEVLPLCREAVGVFYSPTGQ